MGAQVLWDLLEIRMGRGRDEQARGYGKIEDDKTKRDRDFTKMSHTFTYLKQTLKGKTGRKPQFHRLNNIRGPPCGNP